MKKTLVQIALVLAGCCAHGQGTLQFDQGVSPTNAPGGYTAIQPDPTGESFIPTLSSIGFAQFYLTDPNRNIGPTLYVDLWSGSLGNGTLLGQSGPVSVSTTFFGVATFYFQNPITVTPGTTYYLEPIIQSGDSEEVGIVPGSFYANGIAYFSGTPEPGSDLWFREGVVPEPSSLSLAVLGLVGLYPFLRCRSTEPKTYPPCSEEHPSPFPLHSP